MGVLGVGAMGRHHVRVLSELPSVDLVGVVDRDPARATEVATPFGVPVLSDLDSLAERCEAVVVAVPTIDHEEAACALLKRGVDVLVEKPLAPDLASADRMIAAAEVSGRLLAVGHIEFFNPAVQVLLARGQTPRFVEVQRLATFTPRSLDVDVVLDLMIHDIQIVHALGGDEVAEVRATGIDVLTPRYDIASARIELASGCVANLTASRVSSERVRKLRVFLRSRYLSVDYQLQEVKSLHLVETARGPRIVREDVEVVKAEPLALELQGFTAACRGEAGPVVDGRQGRRALATALEVVAAIG